MRLVIATPLYPPQVGGPAKYAKELKEEFERQGHHVRVVAYGTLERVLPPVVRHTVFFLRLLPQVLRCEGVLALDTWSVGVPALWAARMAGVRCVVRIGGDFLWESYVARTGELVKLSDFYAKRRAFSLKERLIRAGTRYMLRRATAAFTTDWQRNIWQQAYDCADACVVENFYPAAGEPSAAGARVFVSAGRDIALKNKKGLHDAFGAVKKKYPDIELDERPLPPAAHAARIKTAYAVVIASISEVNPNTAIEAAAARKPFIAPEDCGGKDRLSGMGVSVDTADAKALEAGLNKLLEPAAYQSCVDASAHLRPHSWAQMAREYVALLN